MKNESTKTILLIDDEEYICQVVESCVQLFSNWQIISTRSGEEGLAASVIAKPDAIVLDMLMPSMDGFAVLKELQANPELADIPVVLLTARVDLTEPQKLTQLGVQGAIAKPFHPTKIAAEIAEILGW